jgi:hypothetical protein
VHGVFVWCEEAEGAIVGVVRRLIERALEIKAEEMGWTLGQLRGLKPGRDRRTKHDDFTVVVVFLEYGKGEAEPQ